MYIKLGFLINYYYIWYVYDYIVYDYYCGYNVVIEIKIKRLEKKLFS